MFFNHGSIQFLLNVYSDFSQSALKYLKDTETDLNNVLIIMSDFNIRDCLWNSCFLFHSSYKDTLFDIADSFYLKISKPIEYFPTRYSNNDQNLNSVLDLVFLQPDSVELNTHQIHPDWRLSFNHAPISITIPIIKEHSQIYKYILIKNSKEEEQFVKEVKNSIKNLKTNFIININTLEETVNLLAVNIDSLWHKNSKKVNISRYFKAWWDNNCQRDLDACWHSRSLNNWKKSKEIVKKIKREFFDKKINKIANKKCGPQELMNWVKK